MKIQNFNQNQYNLKSKPITCGKQNFLGVRSPEQTFEAFAKWAEETGFVSKVPEIIRSGIVIGEGTQNKVYEIENPSFLLRASRCQLAQIKKRIDKLPDSFPNNNVGQAIGMVGNIQIIIKQNGTPNGIREWHDLFKRNFFDYPDIYFPEKNVHEFIKKIQKVSQMKQEAFNLLIAEIQLIHKQNKRFDDISPRNILIDGSQAFNICDIGDTPKFENSKIPIRILGSLMDKFNFLSAYKLTNKEQKEEIINAEEQIRKRIKIASKYHSLKYDELEFNNALDYKSRI